MLILTRRLDESIIIDDSIEIKLLNIQGKQIKLGIQAPNKVRIIRSELLNQKNTEHQPVQLSSSDKHQ